MEKTAKLITAAMVLIVVVSLVVGLYGLNGALVSLFEENSAAVTTTEVNADVTLGTTQETSENKGDEPGFFGQIKIPVVTGVNFSQNSLNAVSAKSIEAFYEDVEVFQLVQSSFNYERNYPLEFQDGLEYEYELTMENGQKLLCGAENQYVPYNSYYEMSVYPEISLTDYLEAKKSGATEIPVTFSCNIRLTLLGFDDVIKTYTFTEYVELVPCFVESITYISGMPEKAYYLVDIIDCDGALFNIKYADGTEKQAALKQTIDLSGEERYDCEITYELDGKNAIVWESEEVYEVILLDATAAVECDFENEPFESIEIIDFDYHDAFGLKYVTYEITRVGEEPMSFTRKIPVEEIFDFYGCIDIIDGFIVDIVPYDSIRMFEKDEKDPNKYLCLRVGEVFDCVILSSG